MSKDMVKSVAKTFEEYANGNVYKCPHCGDTFVDDREYDPQTGWVSNVDDTHDESGAMCCPECGEWVQFGDYTAEDYAENMGLIDYLEDVYDIDITRSGLSKDAPIKSVKICVAFGGPNIYIDTWDNSVKLYWWTDRAEYPLSTDACNALEDYVEELCY